MTLPKGIEVIGLIRPQDRALLVKARDLLRTATSARVQRAGPNDVIEHAGTTYNLAGFNAHVLHFLAKLDEALK